METDYLPKWYQENSFVNYAKCKERHLMTYKDVFRTLYSLSDKFACLKGGDAGDLNTKCEKLAKEMMAYPQHNLWEPVKFAFTLLPKAYFND